MNTTMEEDLLSEIKELCNIADQKNDDSAFLVFNIGDVVDRVKKWKLTMPRVNPYYALKCNNDPVLLRTLAALNINFDIASKAEMDTVINLGIPPDRILYSNTCKGISHLRHAETLNINLLTFDNVEELMKIKQIIPMANLLLRIRVKISSSEFDVSDPSGCELRDVPSLLEAVLRHNLSVVGISFNLGDIVENPDDFIAAIEKCREVLEIAETKDIFLSLLDIGGGFPGSKSSEDLFTKLAESVNSAIDLYFPPDHEYLIIADPGRYFVTTAFTLCSNIIGKKEKFANPGMEIMYVINEGFFGLFLHTLFHRDEIRPIPKAVLPGTETRLSSIWGRSCDPNDLIAESCFLPEMKMGDWLIIQEMGAYTTSLATTFGGFEKTGVKYLISAETLNHLEKFPLGCDLSRIFKEEVKLIVKFKEMLISGQNNQANS